MKKVIFLDWGLFLHRAVFGWEIQRLRKRDKIQELINSNEPDKDAKIKRIEKEFHPPATYTAWIMVISNLKLIGVDLEKDIVIVAIDGRGNWRRDVDPAYKANRKEKKQKDEIEWLEWYKKFDRLIEQIRESTGFHPIRIDKLEADDIIAVGTRYFKDYECVIISSDSDFDQLVAQPNVKLFSPVTKRYKVITKNPYQILASKIEKEKTDNLISPVLDKVDFDRRKMIVSLLELPSEVEQKVLEQLTMLDYDKEYDLEKMPYPSLRKRFLSIYNSDKIETYEKAVKRLDRKRKSKTKQKKIRSASA